MELLEILVDGGFVFRLLRLCEEIIFVTYILKGLILILVPAFGPCSGVMLEANSNLRYQEEADVANLFEIILRALDASQATFFEYVVKGANIGDT